MRTQQARARLLEDWARYLAGAAGQGAFTRRPLALRFEGVLGPRAGALELYAGMDAPALLSALSRNNAALLRQFVPWSFTGEPAAYMAGRFVRVEAGWPPELAETMIRLADLSKKPELGGRWVAGKTENGATVVMGLTDATSNYLVSGQTGSGKSVALRSAVLQLARDPDNRLVLVDGKMGEGLAGLAAWTDGEGVHHRLWPISQPGIVEAIAAANGISDPRYISVGQRLLIPNARLDVDVPGAPITHSVAPGDTLRTLAAVYQTTAEGIAAANSITNPARRTEYMQSILDFLDQSAPVEQPPTLVTPPGNLSVVVGSNATLTVMASGTAPLSLKTRSST